MQEPWTAQWITTTGANDRHPIFYHTLPDGVDKKVTKARLYICGLGLYEAYLDGVKIGADWLTPGFNAYHLWVQTQTYDVTEMMQSRPKELSILAGDGWYKSRIPFEGSSVGFYGMIIVYWQNYILNMQMAVKKYFQQMSHGRSDEAISPFQESMMENGRMIPYRREKWKQLQ